MAASSPLDEVPSAIGARTITGRPKLLELLASQLAHEIVSGALEPGSAIPPEATLAQRFDVSKTVVREAVQLLGSAGLVQIRHGKRTVVRDSQDWNVLAPVVFDALQTAGRAHAILADLYEVRQLLEPPAARWTAEHGKPTDTERLRQFLVRMRAAADLGDVAAFLSADRDFHLTLIEAAGSNQVLRAIFRDLHTLLLRSFTLPLEIAKMDEIYRQHEAITDAVAAGRGQEAEAALRAHISWAADTDLAQLPA